MNSIIHGYLNNLRILSKLAIGQKLDTKGPELTVYTDSPLTSFFRSYHRDSKDETTRYLQSLYKSIDEASEQLVSEAMTTKKIYTKNKKIQVIINLAEKIKASISGIENLADTYNSYPKTLAMLEGIVQDYAVPTYAQLLEIIPKDRMTKKLLGGISYRGIMLYGEDGYSENEEEADE